jgi:hypothetical protein
LIATATLFALACRAATRLPSDRFHYLFGWWVYVASGVELTALVLYEAGGDNVLLYNIYWPVEFGLLLAISHAIHPWSRMRLVQLMVVFLGVWIGNILLIDPTQRLVNTSVICGALLLSAIYLLRLWYLANSMLLPLRSASTFWLCLAVLVYYGAAGPLLGSINYFLEVDRSLAQFLLRITQVLFVVKFVLMGAACLQARRPTLQAVHDRPR